jgi:hypothetical protein
MWHFTSLHKQCKNVESKPFFFAQPNWHVLTFLHLIFICRVTHILSTSGALLTQEDGPCSYFLMESPQWGEVGGDKQPHHTSKDGHKEISMEFFFLN